MNGIDTLKSLVSVPFPNIKQQLSFHLNTEPNLPNSGDNTTPPGATNQSGSVGGNGYGNGEGRITSENIYSFGNKSGPRGTRPEQDFGVNSFDDFVSYRGGDFLMELLT